MREEIKFTQEDRIVIIAPHPDDERLGYEDTRLVEYQHAVDGIDFTPYMKVFLPRLKSFHPDHRAAAGICLSTIRKQKAKGECYLKINICDFSGESRS